MKWRVELLKENEARIEKFYSQIKTRNSPPVTNENQINGVLF